jgi:hypothetical protein
MVDIHVLPFQALLFIFCDTPNVLNHFSRFSVWFRHSDNTYSSEPSNQKASGKNCQYVPTYFVIGLARKGWKGKIHCSVIPFIHYNRHKISEPLLHTFKWMYICMLFNYAQPTVSRVTRLGELAPIEWLLTLGCGLKITEVVQIFGLLFSTIPAVL